MKKWANIVIAMILVFSLSTPTFAASKSGRFSGKPSTPSIHSTTNTPSSSDSNVYRSGAQRPSSEVTNSGTQGTYNTQKSTSTTPSYSPTRSRSGIGSFLGGMAVGGLLGSMFHPFSSGFGYPGGFPFMGLLLDLVLIAGVIMIVRKIRRRA